MSVKTNGGVLPLSWLDPRTKKFFTAGVAFFLEDYGEYLLRIDEEPAEKSYFLKPFALENGKVIYRMELVLKDKHGKFKRRQVVGEGHSFTNPESNIYIDYGSKFKTLVVATQKKKEVKYDE